MHAIMKVIAGERPQRPGGVSDSIWELVEMCWRQDRDRRPAASFAVRFLLKDLTIKLSRRAEEAENDGRRPDFRMTFPSLFHGFLLTNLNSISTPQSARAIQVHCGRQAGSVFPAKHTEAESQFSKSFPKDQRPKTKMRGAYNAEGEGF